MLLSEIAALTKGRLFGDDHQISALCLFYESRDASLAVPLRRQDLRLASKCRSTAILLDTGDAADLLDQVYVSVIAVDDTFEAIDSILRALNELLHPEDVIIGEGCDIHETAVLYKGVRLGNRVRIGAHCVVGAPGFVFRDTASGPIRLPHFYGTLLDDDVEIGNSVCIDAGMLTATRVGARTKIDNLVQIAHDVTIGNDCTIVAQVGIAGHVRIGHNVSVGGQAGIAPFVRIGNHAQISARSALFDDMNDGEIWSGSPAMPHMHFLRASAALKSFGSRQYAGKHRSSLGSTDEL